MSLDLIAETLSGQTEEPSSWAFYYKVAIMLLFAIPVPVMAGVGLAKFLRMKDYGWRLAIIFCSLSMATIFVVTQPLKLGVDLKGGVILVYEIDQSTLRTDPNVEPSPDDIEWGRLLEQVGSRINPSGTKEIVVRRYGVWQLEIIIPDVDPIEVARIKKLIGTAGALKFRIVAIEQDHAYIISQAEEQSKDPNPRVATSRFVKDGKDNIGYWARVGREQTESNDEADAKLQKADDPVGPVSDKIVPFKVQVGGDTIRNAATGEILQPPAQAGREVNGLEKWLRDQGIAEIDVLMATDDGFDVTGDDLGMVSRSNDEEGGPCVKFTMKGQGIGLMGGLTGSNLPDKQRDLYRRLGIVLDGTLMSAPRVMSVISDQGQITGKFTNEEVKFLVGILQAGSLPAALKQEPISENQIGAMLGGDTIRKGQQAIAISLGAVLLFILVWYRFAGFVACLALAMNMLLIFGLMKFPLRAPLTLPGLAGLVLTVGMSVDANVLIFERIREEMERGAALRMAIRNGFSRATTTIVDANLTTLITAFVLYVIGTDQIRGFAVTLILGILMSMFTAIFCSRVVFDIFERTGRLKTLTMMRVIGATHFDFIGKRYTAATISVILIVIGLVATIGRGKQIFDIDFLGGTSVTMILDQSDETVNETDIRSELDHRLAALTVNGSSVQYSVNRVDVEDLREGTVWKIDSSLEDANELEAILQDAFPLATYGLQFSPPTETQAALPAAPAQGGDEVDAVTPAADLSSESAADGGDTEPAKTQPADEPEAKPAEEPADEAMPEAEPEVEPADAQPADEPEAKPAEEPADEAKPEAKPEPEDQAGDTPEPAKEAETQEQPKKPVDEPKPAEGEGSTDSGAGAEDAVRRSDLPSDTWLAVAWGDDYLLAQADAAPVSDETNDAPADTSVAAENPDAATPADTSAADETEPVEDKASDPPAPDASDANTATMNEGGAAESGATTSSSKPHLQTTTESTLSFTYEINAPTLLAEVMAAAEAVEVDMQADDASITANDPNWTLGDMKGYKQWNVKLIGLDLETAQSIFSEMHDKMVDTPVWPSSSKIGGKVAGDTRVLAVMALVTSLFFIVIYIWIRFQRVIYGLAAVVALVHDVLITLGAIAISYWLAGFLGFLKIEEFKISLPVVAAFLTIIGYSLNDTIVVFDRIREVRGKSPKLTDSMVNISINQTLSRTLLTSFTTFLVVLILYFLGGDGIHGFAFALVVGVVVGTYSSIFVASPALLWMTGALDSPNKSR